MEDHSLFVPDVHFEKIPIKNLVSNQKYQRNLSRAHIANAAANFDPYQINPLRSAEETASIMFSTDNIQLKLLRWFPVLAIRQCGV